VCLLQAGNQRGYFPNTVRSSGVRPSDLSSSSALTVTADAIVFESLLAKGTNLRAMRGGVVNWKASTALDGNSKSRTTNWRKAIMVYYGQTLPARVTNDNQVVHSGANTLPRCYDEARERGRIDGWSTILS
jgi:hypothetical protein